MGDFQKALASLKKLIKNGLQEDDIVEFSDLVCSMQNEETCDGPQPTARVWSLLEDIRGDASAVREHLERLKEELQQPPPKPSVIVEGGSRRLVHVVVFPKKHESTPLEKRAMAVCINRHERWHKSVDTCNMCEELMTAFRATEEDAVAQFKEAIKVVISCQCSPGAFARHLTPLLKKR